MTQTAVDRLEVIQRLVGKQIRQKDTARRHWQQQVDTRQSRGQIRATIYSAYDPNCPVSPFYGPPNRGRSAPIPKPAA